MDADEDGTLHVAYGNMSALLIQAINELREKQVVLTVTTTTQDEAFELALPPRPAGSSSRWAAAFVGPAGGSTGYVRTSVSISAAGDAAVGRCETPGTYSVFAIAA